jgi:hypothetical protein
MKPAVGLGPTRQAQPKRSAGRASSRDALAAYGQLAGLRSWAAEELAAERSESLYPAPPAQLSSWPCQPTRSESLYPARDPRRLAELRACCPEMCAHDRLETGLILPVVGARLGWALG